MRIEVVDTKTWEFDWTVVRDAFPEEYKMDKEEGLSDQEFVKRTFQELGDDRFSDLVGFYDGDGEIYITT